MIAKYFFCSLGGCSRNNIINSKYKFVGDKNEKTPGN